MFTRISAALKRLYRAYRHHAVYVTVIELYDERPHQAWSEELRAQFLRWRREIKQGRYRKVLNEVSVAQETQSSFNGFGDWICATSRLKQRLLRLVPFDQAAPA